MVAKGGKRMNISELRKQEKLSQDDFANIFHVSRQTVSNWENGKSYPDVEMLVKISDYFGISVDQLIKKKLYQVEQKILRSRRSCGQCLL